MLIVEPVLSQNAEEAAFLWLLRYAAVQSPHYHLDELAKLGNRVEAHVDGLRVAGEAGWRLAREQAEQQKEAGEGFAAAALAFESRDKAKIGTFPDLAEADPESRRGLVSALGWIGRKALLKGIGLELLEHLVVAVKGTFAFPEVPETRRLQLTWRSCLPLMRSTVSESSPFGYHQGRVRESSGEYRLN